MGKVLIARNGHPQPDVYMLRNWSKERMQAVVAERKKLDQAQEESEDSSTGE